MPELPPYLPLLFILTTLLTFFLFYRAVRHSKVTSNTKQTTGIFIGISIWLAIQAFLAQQGVYSEQLNHLPPKIFLFGLLPTILTLLFLFVTSKGRTFINALPVSQLTILNVIRIPVEIGLLLLYRSKAVPIEMTFEGWNFDILMGLTAPLIFYYGFYKRRINKRILLIWNIIGIILLTIIVITAFLAAPFPLQQIAFDQPNIAVLHFPYVWLPTFIVPIVFFGHFVSIKRLFK